METTVDRIKRICKERSYPIAHLERACGFANGYISQLRKGTLPDDRLRKVAEILELSPEYLSTGEDPHYEGYDPEVLKIAQAMKENGILASAMTGLKAEDMQRVADFALALKSTYRET